MHTSCGRAAVIVARRGSGPSVAKWVASLDFRQPSKSIHTLYVLRNIPAIQHTHTRYTKVKPYVKVNPAPRGAAQLASALPLRELVCEHAHLRSYLVCDCCIIKNHLLSAFKTKVKRPSPNAKAGSKEPPRAPATARQSHEQEHRDSRSRRVRRSQTHARPSSRLETPHETRETVLPISVCVDVCVLLSLTDTAAAATQTSGRTTCTWTARRS